MSSAKRDENYEVAAILQNTLGTGILYPTAVTLTNSTPQHVAIVDATGSQLTSLGISTISTDFYPMYNRRDLGGTNLATDPSGALVTRAAILTDEGTARANFTNSAVSASLGTCTFTNGSTTVTGTGFNTTDVHYLDYIKLNADAESAWAQISFVNSSTQITLFSPYSGTGGTGASSFAQVGTTTGTGATISVASGVLTEALGTNTTSASATNIYRGVSDGALRFISSFSISQRVANQDIYAGLESVLTGTIKTFSRFHFTSTTNTQVITETGYNPTGAPSASEQETNTITLPGGVTTATAQTYRIDRQFDQIKFFINDVLVATHTKRIPHVMNDGSNSVYAVVRGINSGVVTNTNVIVDYLFTKNYNRIDTYQTDTETVNSGSGKTLKSITGSASATFTAVSAVTNKRIKVYSLSLITASATAVTVTMKDAASGTALATYPLQAVSGTNFGITENVATPSFLFATTAGNLLEMSFSAAQTVTYNLRYFDDDAN